MMIPRCIFKLGQTLKMPNNIQGGTKKPSINFFFYTYKDQELYPYKLHGTFFPHTEMIDKLPFGHVSVLLPRSHFGKLIYNFVKYFHQHATARDNKLKNAEWLLYEGGRNA